VAELHLKRGANAFSQASASAATIGRGYGNRVTRILLVEDEVRLATAIKRGLNDEGFAVDIALDGNEGLRLARQGGHAVVLLDIMLPGASGFDICSALRAEDNWTPILMLTARDAARDIARALDAGADDYLAKPFSFMVLVARIRALLRRAGEERPQALQVGTLHLDPATRRCFRGTHEVELTSREFAVLGLLMRRAGLVLSKLDIVAAVWDVAFEGDLNIVEVYIRRIRVKVDEPFGVHSIETVRGAGYRLKREGH
jgi:DNA-binding response OmpR family regulator